MPQEIFAPWNAGLGDQWCCISLLIQLSRSRGQPVYLHSPPHLRKLHVEILAELVPTGASCVTSILLTYADPTRQLSGYDVWACPVVPTHRRWFGSAAHPNVTYQFDGASCAEDKNPNQDEEHQLIVALARSGFNPIRLDRSLDIHDCIDALSTSAFFVGVDSGMAHVAHSVGVPTFLLEFTLPIITCHRGKAFIQCGSRHEGRFAVEDFLRHKLPTYIDYLRFMGHADGARSTVPGPRDRRARLEETGTRWWSPVA